MNRTKWNYSVPGTVKVHVTDGSLALKGSVEWQYRKEEAERAVRSLKGVKWVSNEITVRPKADAVNVKIRIEDALKRNGEMDSKHVTVKTTGGNVTLRGYVRSWTGREQAVHAAWAAPGVARVDDFITINY